MEPSKDEQPYLDSEDQKTNTENDAKIDSTDTNTNLNAQIQSSDNPQDANTNEGNRTDYTAASPILDSPKAMRSAIASKVGSAKSIHSNVEEARQEKSASSVRNSRTKIAAKSNEILPTANEEEAVKVGEAETGELTSTFDDAITKLNPEGQDINEKADSGPHEIPVQSESEGTHSGNISGITKRDSIFPDSENGNQVPREALDQKNTVFMESFIQDYTELQKEQSIWPSEDAEETHLRHLESPIPSEASEGFRFLPLMFGRDAEKLDFMLTEDLSEEEELEPATQTEKQETADSTLKSNKPPSSLRKQKGSEEILYDSAATPILHPSTPTLLGQAGERIVLAEIPHEEEKLIEVRPVEVKPFGEVEEKSSISQEEEALLEDTIDRDALISNIKSGLEIKDRLIAKNLILQNKLSDHFRRKRSDDTREGEKSVQDQEQRYSSCINALTELKNEFDRLNVANQQIVDEIKNKLEEKKQEAEDKYTEFTKFKRLTCVTAENSRTGKAIPKKVQEQLENTETRKDLEVIHARLENIKLRNRLRRHELLLRQKEELADGLHLIDFEQLKIENQTYNEKIEERNEELLKLKKKITNIVQVLTHVKEKLQFVQSENVELKEQLQVIDEEVTRNRDTLPSNKHERDELRHENTVLRQKNGLLGNTPLLRDFENKVDEAEELRSRLAKLRAYHGKLSASTLSIQRKLQKRLKGRAI